MFIIDNANSIQSKSRVIINADDFGITKGVNSAIFQLAENGILTSTSVMSNMPYATEIVHLKNKIGIGIHLNLTTGAPTVERTKQTKLTAANGKFFPLPQLIKKMLRFQIPANDIENELRGQIESLMASGIMPDHINSHESLMKYPFFINTVRKLACEYHISGVRTYDQRTFNYRSLIKPAKILKSLILFYQKLRWKKAGFVVTDKIDSLLKVNLTYEEAVHKLMSTFQNLPQGVLEFVVHPGYVEEDVHSLGDYIYEREIELQALLSQEVQHKIKSSHSPLISFNEIRKNGLKN